MGYYTKHDLKIETEIDLKKLEEIERYILDKDLNWEINSLNGKNTFTCINEELLESGESEYFSDEPTKWYRNLDDMKEMSLNFKDIIFRLDGKGEESGDIWRAYYLNGKEQYIQAKLVFDEFDERKMV